MKRSYILFYALTAAFLWTAAGVGAEERTLYDSGPSFASWQAGGPDAAVTATTGRLSVPGQTAGLQVEATGAGRAVASVEPGEETQDWTGWSGLVIRFYWPAGQPTDVDLRVFIEDRYLNRYEHAVTGPIEAGAWNRVRVKLTGDRPGWRPAGHGVPWDGYCLQDIRRLGIAFPAAQVKAMVFSLDRVALTRREEPQPRRNSIQRLRQNVRSVPLYGTFELSFGLRRTYSNPFDPDVVSVSGVFIRPDGTEVRVPGFFYQGYRRDMQDGREVLTPSGTRHWKIRYTPRQTGVYHYYVEVRDGDLLRSPIKTFEVVPARRGSPKAEQRPGFVRISEQDPGGFEFSSGEPFYPIGHNIAAPQNFRREALPGSMPPEQGTYAYDHLLSTMSENGENVGRVWMVPPGFELEWSREYSPHYQGPGRYNLRKAWQLDHVVEKAHEEGIYLLLLITSHRELAEFGSYFEPGSSAPGGFPYAEANGGPLSEPREFFTSEKALELYRQKLRYITARWGHATSLMGWELLDEPDRLDFYRNSYTFGQRAAQFVRKAGSYLDELEPTDHLFTSNCYYYRSEVAAPVLSLDVLDFTTGHIYASDLEARLSSAHRYMQQRYDKLFLVTEAGVTPFAQDPKLTERAIHRMLWASHMLPLPGTAMPWWWGFVDGQGLYSHFAALRAFAEGQDRRKADFQSASASVSATDGGRTLQIMTLKSEGRALCWIYEPAAFKPRAEWQETRQSGAEVRIPNMSAGRYVVEIWDTYQGTVMEQKTVTLAEKQPLTFAVPSFSRDVAVKVFRQGAVR